MSLPDQYTEDSLAGYMHDLLGKVAQVLGYAVGAGTAGSYQEAVNATLLRYGVSSLDAALDLRKLRALAALEAWNKACADLAALYPFALDQARYERGEMFKQAELQRAGALREALEWDPGYQVRVSQGQPLQDPYASRKEAEC